MTMSTLDKTFRAELLKSPNKAGFLAELERQRQVARNG
jgi:hypothetical protein